VGHERESKLDPRTSGARRGVFGEFKPPTNIRNYYNPINNHRINNDGRVKLKRNKIQKYRELKKE